MSSEILRVKTFSEIGGSVVMGEVDARVNAFLCDCPASQVHSIGATVTEGNDWVRYTVTVVVREQERGASC